MFSFLDNNSFIVVNKENLVFGFSSFGFVRLKIRRNVLNIKVLHSKELYTFLSIYRLDSKFETGIKFWKDIYLPLL